MKIMYPNHLARRFFVLSLSFAFALASCVVSDDDSRSDEHSPAVIEASSAFTVVPYNHALKIPYGIEPRPAESDSENTENPEESAEVDSTKLSYQWYESEDGTTESGTAISGADKRVFVTPAFTEPAVRHYYCVATQSDGTETTSPVYTAAYAGLPLLQIDTVDGEEPYGEGLNYKEGGGNYGYGLINATKVPARMQLFIGGTKAAVYDSGEYEDDKSGLTIKIRGNTSAAVGANGPGNAKHPYKLKLQKKADLLAKLGRTDRADKAFKNKNWILLKDATSLNTFVGMTVADIAGTPWTPEFAFVNVMLNGDYRGVYLLIESISRNETRVDVAEDGWIIERDAYWWNEEVKFTTALNQKYTFKYPDDDTMTVKQLLFIQNYFAEVEAAVKDGSYEDYIDTESFARWQLIHDILGTWDSAGSNIYLSKYDSTDSKNPSEDGTWSKLVMSTPWDFDSNYRMADKWSNQHGGTRLYENYLFKSENTAYLDSYKAQWETLSPLVWTELSEKLDELSAMLGDDINFSRSLNAERWNTSPATVEENIATAEDWFASRVPWLDEHIGGL